MTAPNTGREEFASLTGDADGPVVTHLMADLDVSVGPLAAYTVLADRNDYGFPLESAEKISLSNPQGAFSTPVTAADSHARFSFVGYDPETVVTVGPDGADVTDLGSPTTEFIDTGDDDILDPLRGALPNLPRINFPETNRQALTGGLIGFLAYEVVYDLWLSEISRERPDTDDPDAESVLMTRTLSFGHREDAVRLVCTPVVSPDDDPGEVCGGVIAEARRVAEKLRTMDDLAPDSFEQTGEDVGSREEYETTVRKMKKHVHDDDIYQDAISHTRKLCGQVDPVDLYTLPCEVNPSPYMFLLRYGDRRVVGASSETFVSVRDDRVVISSIAGTCQRGSGPVKGRRLADEPLADAEKHVEHTVLVDLGRNDVCRASAPGSIRVEGFMNAIEYSHVRYIESTVPGALGADADAFDATQATFPAGTLTGAPKVRAMEVIDDLEAEPHGVYGGDVGYYLWIGDTDVTTVIRTTTVDSGGAGDTITVRAGTSIVADSDLAAEYEETE